MKKKIAVVLACMMMFAGAGSVFAQEAAPAPSANESLAVEIDETAAHVKKVEVIKEFRDELHTINALRIERLGLKSQIVQKQDQILDLTIAARENGDKEALKEAAEVRKQIHVVSKELDVLWEKFGGQMKAFKEAVKSGSKVQAQIHIDGAIAILGTINGNLGQKVGLLDKIIAILG